MALGMVMQLPDQDDETSVSRRQLLAKLDVCMGGRVAEELIFGESNITTGVTDSCLSLWILTDLQLPVSCIICSKCACMSCFKGQSVGFV